MKTQTVLQKNIMPHARIMKRQFNNNTQQIIKTLNITPERYYEYQFECGISFLEMYYDASYPGQQEWINRFSKMPKYGFWDWWKGEWKIAEHYFLKFHHRGFDYNDWIMHMYAHTVSERMQQSFYNYIKFKNHEL